MRNKGFGIQAFGGGFLSGKPSEDVFSDEDIIQAAFRHFRRTGFPYRRLPLHVCLQEVNKLARTSNKKLLYTSVGLNVADTYHPHRFHGRHSRASKSQADMFQNDEWLVKCLRRTLKLEGEIDPNFIDGLRYFSGHACSNFRPGFALYLYRRFCRPGAVVLDTSTGYGGRLVGFFASTCGRYIGIDPNSLTHKGNMRMARDFGRSDDVELYPLPAEDVECDRLAGRADFAFTSPPYFHQEIYSDEPTQSCHRYKTEDEWVEGFLFPVMRLQYAALKPGCFSCVNVADVLFKSKTIPLVKWTEEAGCAAGFRVVGRESYGLRRHLGSGGNDNKHVARSEPVLVFQKQEGC